MKWGSDTESRWSVPNPASSRRMTMGHVVRKSPGRALVGRLLVAVVLAVVGMCSEAAASEPRVPPQGVYESCNIQYEAERCASRLRTIGAAGFRAVLNYQQFYADRAHL